MPATYEPIATTTLGSATASITFSSISGSYTDLRLVLTGTTSANGNTIWIRYNGDTGTNYSRTFLRGDGSAAASNRNTDSNQIYVGDGAVSGTSSTVPGFWSVDIFNYAGSTNKTALATESMDKNGSGVVQRDVSLWRNTAAITSITISSSATNLNSGFTATLYGILRAT